MFCQTTRGSFKLTDSKQNHCRNESECPTWFTCDSNNKCVCGNRHSGAVVCDDQRLISAVLDCHCVTYDKESRSTSTGICFYNCENHHSQKKKDTVTTPLPKRAEILLNRSVCSYFSRTGLLCGDCEEGHHPLVLSYNLSCIKCPDGHKNWWKFVLIGFLPLTFFFFFVVLFNINVTSSRLNGVVWFSQALSVSFVLRLAFSGLAPGNPVIFKTVKVFLIFYTFWNLDFFRSVLPDICLNITTIQSLALEYLIAIYPFVLILLSYFIIKLHDRKCKFIVTVWKPFHKVLNIFKKTWDIRTSIIDSFATFLLLSYVKILNTSTDLLVPTQVYKLGSNISTLGLYYSPSVEYFGDEHLPYAILATLMLILFVWVPIVVSFLYPFKFFQKFLSLFPFNWHFLHAFADSFQGCYKDGTEPGTFDCRWFSALFLFSRFLVYITYSVTMTMISYAYIVIVLVIFSILMINIQPFKKATTQHHLIDPIFLILLSLAYTANLGRDNASYYNHYNTTMTTLLISTTLVPLFYIAILVGSWLFSRRRWINKFIKGFLH